MRIVCVQATMVGIEDISGETQQWEAEVVGSDPSHDLAVLQIQAPANALAPIKVKRPWLFRMYAMK